MEPVIEEGHFIVSSVFFHFGYDMHSKIQSSSQPLFNFCAGKIVLTYNHITSNNSVGITCL